MENTGRSSRVSKKYAIYSAQVGYHRLEAMHASSLPLHHFAPLREICSLSLLHGDFIPRYGRCNNHAAHTMTVDDYTLTIYDLGPDMDGSDHDTA